MSDNQISTFPSDSDDSTPITPRTPEFNAAFAAPIKASSDSAFETHFEEVNLAAKDKAAGIFDIPNVAQGSTFYQFSKILTENSPQLYKVLANQHANARNIIEALFASVRLPQWKLSEFAANAYQIQTFDESVYVQVTAEHRALGENDPNPIPPSITVFRGLSRYPIAEGEVAEALYTAIANAQSAIKLSLEQRIKDKGWEEYEDEGANTPEALLAILDAADSLPGEIGDLTTLSKVLDNLMAKGEEVDYYTVAILETLAASRDLKEWKYIGADNQFSIWTENDGWLIRVSPQEISLYLQGSATYLTVKGKNASILFEILSDSVKSAPPCSRNIDDEDVLSEVASDLISQTSQQLKEAVAKTVIIHDDDEEIEMSVADAFEEIEMSVADAFKEIEMSVADALTVEDDDTEEAPVTPEPNNATQEEETMSGSYIEKANQANMKDDRPSKTAGDKAAADEGTLQYLKSVEGRVLTIMEAAFPNAEQREAVKTLIKKEFRREMSKVNRVEDEE